MTVMRSGRLQSFMGTVTLNSFLLAGFSKLLDTQIFPIGYILRMVRNISSRAKVIRKKVIDPRLMLIVVCAESFY